MAHEEQLSWRTDDFDETYFLTVILKMKKHNNLEMQWVLMNNEFPVSDEYASTRASSQVSYRWLLHASAQRPKSAPHIQPAM